MSQTKTMGTYARIHKHNGMQLNIMNYINHRKPNAKLVNYSGTRRDIDDGEDFGNGKYSYQSKWRESGDDIIYESDKFYPQEEGKWNRKPGRDARCKADFYVTKPAKDNTLVFQSTKDVKLEVLNSMKGWGVPVVQKEALNGVPCKCADLSDNQITLYYEKARATRNKSLEVYRGDNGVVVKFKIEEGDRQQYCKLLFFIPFQVLKGQCLPLLKNEVLADHTTWV